MTRLALPLLVVWLGVSAAVAAPVDPRLAPPEEEAAERAESWVRNRKTGAAVLWGGLLVASVIIGVVRARQRRRARGGRDEPSHP